MQLQVGRDLEVRQLDGRPGRLEFVPLASERPTQRLQRGQLVGELRRGRRSEPIAFDLERGEDGEWLVSGLGR